MYSAFYRYISIYPISKHNILHTTTVENVIRAYNIFEGKEKGNFINVNDTLVHINMQLMKVKDYNSWSDKDFDSEETNYISITISRDNNDGEPIIDYLINIAKKLQWVLFDEDDEDGIILFSPNNQYQTK